MEWTEEQQTEINRLVEEAKTEATKGLFTQEQLNSEIGKAKEGLFSQEDLDKLNEKINTEKVKPLEDELAKLKPKDKTETEKLLEQKDSELKAYKLKEKLTENKLPSNLYKFLSGEGEELDNNINELSEIINNFVVDGSFKGGQHKKSDGITKEQFSAMNYSQRAKLSEENPTLYNKLISQQ